MFVCLDREKDEDEGIPSETEDDKRQLETKAKEMRGEREMFIVCVCLHENRDKFVENTMVCYLLMFFSIRRVSFFIFFPSFHSLFLTRLARSVETEGCRDPVSAGGEGAAVQGDVGRREPSRGGLPADRTFLQVGL